MEKRFLGLYIHFPFCVHHCVYCDFVVREIKQKSQLSHYMDALKKEITFYAGKIRTDYSIDSIYFGGGTPSLYGAPELSQLLADLRNYFDIQDNVEISLEANPNGLSFEKLAALREIGITRLSMGVQSFSPRHLKTLERIHSDRQACEAISMAKKNSFSSLNIDLIFGIPDQTLEDLEKEMVYIKTLSPDHLSAYQLTLYPDNPLYSQLPEDKITASMYVWLIKALSLMGYGQYEVSSFAKPAHQCRHNLKYWSLSDFLGLGVGSYSRLSHEIHYPYGHHFKNVENLETYYDYIKQGKKPLQESEILSESSMERDYLLTHLRLLQGISIEDYENRFHRSFCARYQRKIEYLEKEGLLDSDEKMIRLTVQGLLFLNQVLVHLI